MSKETMVREIKNEIEYLNQEVDLKIIRGYSYKRESRRHKFLLSQLSTLNGSQTHNWLGKTMRLVSTFIL